MVISIGENQSLRLPASQVLCWADDRLQLYRYRLDHRTKSDLLTHLEAARWCIRENLLEPAAAELKAAQAIDAAHPRVAQVETMLQTIRQQALEKASESKSPAETKGRPEQTRSPEGGAAKPEGEATTRSDVEPAERSATTLARLSKSTIADYASRVQPILINRCGQAGCHGGRDAQQTDWRLTLPPSRHQRRLPAEMTRGNLRDLVHWIDRNEPRSSPLLGKATERHAGMQDSPLGPADDDVLAELENWIASVAGELQEEKPSAQRRIAAIPPNIQGEFAAPIRDPGRGEPLPDTNQMHVTESPRPKRLPPVTNPFDPQVFNRLHHRDVSTVRR